MPRFFSSAKHWGRKMTDISLEPDRRAPKSATQPPREAEVEFHLPILPKVGLIANIVAAIWMSVAAVVATLLNPPENVGLIVLFSNLILCFLTGAIVAGISSLVDWAAKKAYKSEATKKNIFSKCADVIDFSAVGFMVASLAVFSWGVWMGSSSMRVLLA
jgi:hypothetical protein